MDQERYKLTWPDYVFAPLIAVLAGIWTFPYVGTALNWDALFYMNLSQYTTAQGIMLNRYGHIYMQKFFFWLAGDAITGGKVYWCFLFFGTCVLIYWCSQILGGRKSYFAGLMAVLSFYMQPMMTYWGSPLADYAVAFLVMLGTFLYLAFITIEQKHYHLFIIILGLLFFWAVKSKETGIWMGVLFLGLGTEKTGVRSMGRFIKDIGWVCVGMLAGCVLLMTLDLVFMGDALFSVRPSSIRELFGFNTALLGFPYREDSWYIILSAGPILPFFLLYLLRGQNLSKREIAAWLIPLSTVAFLTLVTMRVSWDFPVRFLLPAMAGMSIWAAQFFQFDLVRPKKLMSLSENSIGFALAFIALLIVFAVMHKIEYLIGKENGWLSANGWKSIGDFYNGVILPFATTIVLLIVIAFKKRGPAVWFFLFLCLFFIVYGPFRSNLTELTARTIANWSERRYEPYRVFAGELRLDKDVKILVSKDIYEKTKKLGRDLQSHCWMFNVFFNQKFDYENFIDGNQEDILKGNYTYAFLTEQEWREIYHKYNVKYLLNDYTVKGDRATQLILLKKR